MPIIEILLSSFNPDFEKRKKLFGIDQDMIDDCYENYSLPSFTDNFIYCSDISSAEQDILSEIDEISKLPANWNNLGSNTISSEIIDNTLKLIELLPPSILYYLKAENIYPSDFGTIIMDWEFDKENLFSLEIAKKSIGYFVELNGKNHKQVDRISFTDENINTIVSSINNDISLFL